MNNYVYPRVVDSVSYLYFEKCHIEQDDCAVKAVFEDNTIAIPCANLTVLLLGPGTTITHADIVNLSKCGCLVVWCGENIRRYYTCASSDTHSSKNILIQAKACMDSNLHLEVVRRMYRLRFDNMSVDGMSLNQLRGLEGTRMKTAYHEFARHYGVTWVGKRTGHNRTTDIVNKCLDYNNALLYALTTAVINTLGYNNSLGFIHLGHIDSFVFDIADLYKVKSSIPSAFEVAGRYNKGQVYDLYGECRTAFRRFLQSNKIVEHMVEDIKMLFEGIDTVYGNNTEGNLWDMNKEIEGHRNYGGDST